MPRARDVRALPNDIRAHAFWAAPKRTASYPRPLSVIGCLSVTTIRAHASAPRPIWLAPVLPAPAPYLHSRAVRVNPFMYLPRLSGSTVILGSPNSIYQYGTNPCRPERYSFPAISPKGYGN